MNSDDRARPAEIEAAQQRDVALQGSLTTGLHPLLAVLGVLAWLGAELWSELRRRR
ncbi:MAG: hypothetical protein JWM77_2082 [Rhodospirillales bacterium]|jgi:hypothetical protein|nr:hypothetical protein [Rhodospirillales bacterium]